MKIGSIRAADENWWGQRAWEKPMAQQTGDWVLFPLRDVTGATELE